jgi:ribosomal protein S18 acetylase RimI-like enzyme
VADTSAGAKQPGRELLDQMANLSRIGEISAAMEENIAEFYREFGASSPDLDLHSGPDVVWVLSNISSPLINALVHARGTPGDVPEIVDAAIARGRAKGVPLLWWVCPDASPPTLPAELIARGFTPAADMPGMLVDLGAVTPASPPYDLKIERVTQSTAATAWCDVLCESFELPPGTGAFFHDFLVASGSSAGSRTQHFIGYFDGMPVATASLVIGHDVAGIYCVATLASARRRGIGAAMTRHAMQVAKDAGASTAVLQATAAGEPVYRGLGFEERCRVTHYLWQPDGVRGPE